MELILKMPEGSVSFPLTEEQIAVLRKYFATPTEEELAQMEEQYVIKLEKNLEHAKEAAADCLHDFLEAKQRSTRIKDRIAALEEQQNNV